jgi:glutamine synthetase type III
MKLKMGDVILYSTSEEKSKLKPNIGYILKIKEDGDYVVLSSVVGTILYKKNIKEYNIETIENVEIVRNDIKSYYEKQISELESQIKTVTSEEKEGKRKERYIELQKQIKTTAKNLYESTNDHDFENRLKAITEMKKSIFSIELECVSQIRIENRAVKYKIKELERQLKNSLDNISDEQINNAFQF